MDKMNVKQKITELNIKAWTNLTVHYNNWYLIWLNEVLIAIGFIDYFTASIYEWKIEIYSTNWWWDKHSKLFTWVDNLPIEKQTPETINALKQILSNENFN